MAGTPSARMENMTKSGRCLGRSKAGHLPLPLARPLLLLVPTTRNPLRRLSIIHAANKVKDARSVPTRPRAHPIKVKALPHRV